MRKKYKGMGVQEDINVFGIFMLLKTPLLILSTLLVATTFFDYIIVYATSLLLLLLPTIYGSMEYSSDLIPVILAIIPCVLYKSIFLNWLSKKTKAYMIWCYIMSIIGSIVLLRYIFGFLEAIDFIKLQSIGSIKIIDLLDGIPFFILEITITLASIFFVSIFLFERRMKRIFGMDFTFGNMLKIFKSKKESNQYFYKDWKTIDDIPDDYVFGSDED